MKTFKNKQLVLKGALLAVLGANLSWNPAAYNSLDLASTGEVMADGSATAQEETVETVKAAEASEEAVEAKEKKDDSVRQLTKKVCGKRFLITFREMTIDNELKTEMEIVAHSEEEAFQPVKYRMRGGLSLNLDNASVRKEVESDIDRLVKSRFGGQCPNTAAVAGIAKPIEAKKVISSNKPSNKRTAGECRFDKNGGRLDDLERAECLLGKLADLDSLDDDRRSRTKVTSQIEKTIKGELRSIVKKKLMSNDEVDNEEGRDLLEQIIDEVQDLADLHDIDRRRADRWIKELEALRVGGETYRRGSALAEEVNSMRTDLQSRMQQAQAELQANPNDIWMRQQVLNLQAELLQQQTFFHQKLQAELASVHYNSLASAQRMGFINATEFKEFTNPFTMLRQQLISSINVTGNSLPGLSTGPNLNTNTFSLPSDFMQYRTGLAQGTAGTATNATTLTGPNRFSANPAATPVAPLNPMLGNYGLSTLTNPLTGTFTLTGSPLL